MAIKHQHYHHHRFLINSMLIFIIFITIILSSRSNNTFVESKKSVREVFQKIYSFIRSIGSGNSPADDYQRSHQEHFDRHQIIVKQWEKNSSLETTTTTRIWLTIRADVNTTGYNPKKTTRKRNNQDDVDSSSSTLLIRTLEIHWQKHEDQIGQDDRIELYHVDDESNPLEIYYIIKDNNNNSSANSSSSNHKRFIPNSFQTNFTFNYQNISNLPPEQYDNKCLEYFILYLNDQNEIEAKNCIRLQSKWMERELSWIGQRKLSEIMIPGTHDASSYQKYSYSYEKNALIRLQYTQDENLYNQLMYGIRYLDMRVGCYNLTINNDTEREILWMVHDILENDISLEQALDQILKFLRQTTHEILIVDFHRFVNGIDKVKDLNAVRRRLKMFVDLVIGKLGSYAIPYNNGLIDNIETLIHRQKRVMIGYEYKNNKIGAEDSNLLWPAVEHIWANTDDIGKLEKYIDEHVCPYHYYYYRNLWKNNNNHRQNQSSSTTSYSNNNLPSPSSPPLLRKDIPIRMRSVMAELTPDFTNIFLRKYHGLRELATLVNKYFNEWFRNRWINCTNIVAADFFLGSDIVQISIDVNRERFSSSSSSSEPAAATKPN